MKKDFITIIEESLQKLGIDAIPSIDVEVPPAENFGDRTKRCYFILPAKKVNAFRSDFCEVCPYNPRKAAFP